MPSLGETTAMLARLKRAAEAASSVGADGETVMTETTAFGPNPGSLRMLSYAPAGLAPGAPLVVVLHGCTQRAEPHAEQSGWLALADRYGFAVLAPEQTPSNNFNRCFNWYEPADASRGKGEAASIRAMVARMIRTHGLDAERVFVTGLSAGGAMASVMLAAYPEVFAAGAVIAGLPFGVAGNLQEALGAMYGRRADGGDLGELVRVAAPRAGRLPRVAIWHGDADSTVKAVNATDVAAQWASAHGLAKEPDQRRKFGGRTQSLWRSSDRKQVLIESNLVHGMDHGTPLATRGPEGSGRAGPHMLEVGLSSSLEILRFWGVAAPADASAPRDLPARRRAAPRPHASAGPGAAQPASVGDALMHTLSRHVPSSVNEVIAKALKGAGLMG